MTSRTKMIIITSDEDIIRKFSLNKTKNTHIIHLDDDEQEISTEIDDHQIINMALLAESNSNNDSIHKRAFDSSYQNPVKASKKSMNMICVICGNRAIGYNYDVLSCASCKAFFRRTADRNVKCLTGQDQCSIAYGIRRKCPKCRLERSFAAGMRKEFFRSEEEKQRRKKKFHEKQNKKSQRSTTSESTNSSSIVQSASNCEFLPPSSDEIDHFLIDVDKVDSNIVCEEDSESNGIDGISFGTLSIEDWMTIQKIQSLFISYFQAPKDQSTKMLNLSDHASALISWLEYGNQLFLRFIKFLRQINEFEELLLDDRFILIKYNIFSVFPVTKCYNYKHADDCYSTGMSEAEKHRRFFMLFDASNTIRDISTDLVVSLIQITEQDPTVLSLLLIILILTPGLSMNKEEPPINDSLGVNRVQYHYTRLLWNYFVNQWGEIQACRRFTQLLTFILRLQSKSEIFRLFFRDQYTKSNTVNTIGSLMQSVLNIS